MVSLKRPANISVSVTSNEQKIKYVSKNTIIKKKYKVPLTRQALTSFSTMFLIIEKEENGESAADVTFSSDSGITIKDITSITENELADVIRKYRIFVECIKKEEQKELSSTKKNLMNRIFSRSNIRQFAKAVNATSMKKTMMTNGAYMKKAFLSTAKINKVISELNNLKNTSINRDIYTKINVGEIFVVTRTTIELDADIVSIIQNEPEAENLTLRNFILEIHMANVSLSTFYSLNKINEIFHNCGMIIGFSRMATTPFSIYGAYLAAITVNPIPILFDAIPTGLFILIPRIARLIIKHKLGKVITVR